MKRPTSMFLLSIVAIAFSACGGEAPYDLTVEAQSLPSSSSLTLGLAEADGDRLIDNESLPTDGGALDGTYGAILVEGASYELSLFVDLNDNQRCDPPPTDRVFRTTFGPVTDDVTVSVNALELDAAGCDHFASE